MWKITATEYICRFLICKKIVFLSSFFFLFSGILLFCWFVYFVCLLFTWVWHLFFSSCFLLIGFLIWIHFSGVSFYFECAASRFQYNRWILFFSTWTIFGHLYDFHFISVHNICLLLPMKEGNHFVIMIFCWYFSLLNEIFFFLRLMIKNDDRIIARYDHEILT